LWSCSNLFFLPPCTLAARLPATYFLWAILSGGQGYSTPFEIHLIGVFQPGSSWMLPFANYFWAGRGFTSISSPESDDYTNP
jgi:hypothetical protein